MATRSRAYLTPYLRGLRLLDLLTVMLSVLGAQFLRFGSSSTSLGTHVGALSYTAVSAALILGWMTALHLQNAYDGRLVGHGVQEYRQVFHASTWLFAALAITAFALKLDFARGYVILAFPLGTLFLLAGRWSARRWLVSRRRAGELSDRVLLVGDREHVASLVVALRRAPDAGYNVLGACVDTATSGWIEGVPILGPETDVLLKAVDLGADVVAISSSTGLGQTGLRRLGWALEGTKIDLVVAPGIMDVAGPRVLTRPVQGLPLIHVEAPTFVGPALVAKGLLDRVGALIAMIVLSPVLVAVAIAVKLEDGGPVLFRQERVGRDGNSFGMLKFRTMVVDAEARLPQLLAANEGAGPLFKLHRDPRVTKVGRALRKYSLDELAQLVNVLVGDMSLVGPRPPLPREVAEYEAHVRRRLLVKPGMTGLWQISGRSNLSWEEAVRLDLYYVENWTPVLDLMIMWRTAQVVIQPDPHGAY
ncbi:MAG: sugar transferase [Ornithinimicrobium sp.]|uniref:sugar transferase n=1 Tax=Ornithinimicrobium sp. TaxID=1977084 RepID=UPI0026DF0C64|nr:sugar transferase [Ornithinimicrobium sp.]MDO5739811.1 sugar transferase [Ornithinimicrobium sp.]